MHKTSDNHIILENRECYNCIIDHKGFIYSDKKCPECNGTGKSKKGTGKGDCKVCHSFKTVVDFDNYKPCPICKGTNSIKESAYDFISSTSGLWEGLEFIVIRTEQYNTWIDSYIGLGSVYSVVDYGNAYHNTDENIINEVKANNSCHQLIKIVNNENELKLCDKIGIIVRKDGYQVKALFEN